MTQNWREAEAAERSADPDHAKPGRRRWTAKSAALPNGELLTVTATDPKDVQHIRGLLVTGSHHQPHHLAVAKGEFDHEHLGHTR